METKVIGEEYIFVSRDTLDTCAKYVKKSQELGKVDIQVLYRFGKPSYHTQSFERFLSDRKENNSKYQWILN
jgi:hypothetical protein